MSVDKVTIKSRFRGRILFIVFSVVTVAALSWSIYARSSSNTWKEKALGRERSLQGTRAAAAEIREITRKGKVATFIRTDSRRLVGFLEEKARASGMAKEKIRAITPRDPVRLTDTITETVTRINLQDVTLREIVTYLFEIQSGREGGVIMKEFHLLEDRKSKDKWQADISLASLTYTPLEEK